MSANESETSEELQNIYLGPEEQSTSGEEPPRSEWSSLESDKPIENRKKTLFAKELYSPGSGEICPKYVALSDSDVFRHVFYNYPPIIDPGIKPALLAPEKPVFYDDDGRDYYLVLCKEMNQCPVRLFHQNMLNPEINLKYYCVNPAGVRAMALSLEHNKYVKHLDLTDNFLNDDASYHLGRMMATNSVITELILSGCRIGASGMKRFSSALVSNRSLKKLDLSGNCLGEEGGLFFAQSIIEGVVIPEVNLAHNNLGMKTANALAEAFTYRNKMTHFDLSWNNFFHQPSAVRMLESLSDSKVLQELDMSWNSLEGERVAAAIGGLMIIPTLTILKLRNNRFRDEVMVEPLVSKLIKAKKLDTFDLSFNPLTPDDANTIIRMMLKPRVKIKNLLLDNVWVNKAFMACLDGVMKMKSRKDFKVVYGGLLHNWTVKGGNPRELLLLRANYLGSKDKKHRMDVALFFLELHKNQPKISVKDIIDRADEMNSPLDSDLLAEFSEAFPGPKSTKAKFIDLALVAEYIHRLWPDKKLPKTPPPPPIVEEPPPPPPEPTPQKKGKGKK